MQTYYKDLLRKFIKEQLIYFTKPHRVIESCIIASGEVLDSVAVADATPISEML